MSNLQPTPASVKQSILHFIKSMVSPSLFRAFTILLSPCCTISATGIAKCVAKGVYNLTFTLSDGVNLAGMGFASVSGSDPVPYVDDSTVITIPNVTHATGLHNETLQLVFHPGNPISGSSAVVLSYTVFSVPINFPTCS